MKVILALLLFLCIQSKNISKRGAYMIGYFEGFSATAYWDKWGKVWTIGYGHTGDVKQGQRISKAQGLTLLQKDCKSVEKYVNDKKYVPQTASLNQQQFDALVSFGYNLGPGYLPKLCKGKTMKQIAQDIHKYCHAGGEVLPGLVRRRKAESNLILHGKTMISDIDNAKL